MQNGTYAFMEGIFEDHGFDYSDLGKKLIDFIKKWSVLTLIYIVVM